MRSSWWPFVLVSVGGALGANARFLLARWVGSHAATGFPLGTFLVNVFGSFALGVLGGAIAARMPPAADGLRLALGVGFLGAFTTFSTFAYETMQLLEDGAWATAMANIVVSLVCGLVALRVGTWLARAWLG